MEYRQPQNQEPQDDIQSQPQGPTPPPVPVPTPIPAPAPAQAPKKRLTSQVIIIAILSLLLIATAATLGYLLLNQDDDSDSSAVSTATSEGKVKTEEVAKDETPDIKDEYEGWKTFSKEGLADYQAASAIFPTIMDFRYPANWNIIKEQIRDGVAPCAFPYGDMPAIGPKNTHNGGGSVCSFKDGYGETDTINSYAASIVSSSGSEYSSEGEITIGGIRTLVVSRTIEGQKGTIYLVDNIRQVSGSERKGSTFSCRPPSKRTSSVAEIDQFYKDCDLVLKSVKFL